MATSRACAHGTGGVSDPYRDPPGTGVGTVTHPAPIHFSTPQHERAYDMTHDTRLPADQVAANIARIEAASDEAADLTREELRDRFLGCLHQMLLRFGAPATAAYLRSEALEIERSAGTHGNA